MNLPDSVIEKFRSVTQERLERIDAGWNALTRGTASPKADADLLRELHTLKGDARVVGFVDVGVLCQRLEDVVTASRARHYQVHEDVDIVVTMAIQFVAMLVRRRADTARSGIDLDGFLRQIEHVIHECLRRSSEVPDLEGSMRPRVRAGARSSMRPSAVARQRIGDVATVVFLESLRATGASERRLHDAFSSLCDELASLERVPLAPALEVHAQAAGELAENLGKEIQTTIDAANARVSVEVHEAIQTSILHAMRNAVDHGIESPADREALGKPAIGAIHVSARQREEELEVVVVDDGRGVDIEGIRESAIAKGLLSKEAAASASTEEILALAFTPGLSTRTVANEISGRGIGMDAIRDVIVLAGGSVELESEVGRSTTLTMRVPQRRATTLVSTLRTSSVPLPVALETGWIIEPAADGTDAIDLGEELSLPQPIDRAPEVARVKVRKGDVEIILAARAGRTERVASRLCPVLPGALVEVVRIDDREALLLHPEQIERKHPDVSRSTG